MTPAAVAVFGPHPLLSVVIEARPDGADEVHLHAGGQGVWVARMAAELGAHPVLCGFTGGETGTMLAPLLAALRGEQRLVATAGSSGCYVMDRRHGERAPLAMAVSTPPTRHELDDLISATVAAALRAGLLVLCNPYPGEVLPAAAYTQLVTDVRAHGVRVFADLSTPRLDAALEGGLDLVKLNDWELAEYVYGPVDEPGQLAAAAARIRERGADTVVVTRGERPAVVFGADGARELTAPRFDHGFREGCGDAMMGAIAAVSARGGTLDEALITGAAAGAVNFLRRGLGTGDAVTVAELAGAVTLTPLPAVASA